jgi:hypothetical protein
MSTSVLIFVGSSLSVASNDCGDSFETSSSVMEIGLPSFFYFFT